MMWFAVVLSLQSWFKPDVMYPIPLRLLVRFDDNWFIGHARYSDFLLGKQPSEEETIDVLIGRWLLLTNMLSLGSQTTSLERYAEGSLKSGALVYCGFLLLELGFGILNTSYFCVNSFFSFELDLDCFVLELILGLLSFYKKRGEASMYFDGFLGICCDPSAHDDCVIYKT